MTFKKKSSQLIIPGGSGDPRKVAASNEYAPAPKRLQMMKRLAGSKFRKTGAYIGSTAGTTGSSATSVSQSPLYYDPRHSAPDRFYFPKDRATANSSQ